jgi:dTDP-D-glucose 4,6-dehydratase
MDVGKLHELGWKHSIELEDGIKLTYQDFLKKLKHMPCNLIITMGYIMFNLIFPY